MAVDEMGERRQAASRMLGSVGGASVSTSELTKTLKRLCCRGLRQEWVDKPKYVP